MRVLVTAALLLVLGAPALGDESCTCAEAKAFMGWCAAHRVGFVAGVEIRSAELFEALDAHGHDIDPALLRCASCRRAREIDGFCDTHGIGFVHGRAWLSMLTYQLAKAVRRDPATLACPTCRALSAGYGWCSHCARGWAGPLEIATHDDYERFSRAYDRLLEAQRTVARCELCAAAMMVGGRCPICDISYTRIGSAPARVGD